MNHFKKALFLGILASLFFAFTFVFNRSMNLSGGYWGWSACLRYIFTLPIMYIIVWFKKGVGGTIKSIRQNLGQWLLWSTVGFGLFYAPLTLASVFGESWFVAATWQITIVAGILLTPVFGKKLPLRNLLCAVVIIAGIFIMQIAHFEKLQAGGFAKAFLLILVAAISYPLGNRKMMGYAEGLSTDQRVFGMTLCSMPFWLLLSVFSFCANGAPSGGQMIQSMIVALFSGIIATVFFFEATNLVKNNARQLAVIEATQSGEVIFTLLGGIIFLGDAMPSGAGFAGILLIVVGMIANSMISAK